MKKLSFIFAMVFAVSFAMAQKTTWVTQSGNSNTANVTQSACISTDATAIYATQSGDYNALNTTQSGRANYIELDQSGKYNSAVMVQTTCNQDHPLVGDAFTNNAKITQGGNYNSANLTQKEDDTDGWDFSKNTATATQSGGGNAYTLNQGGNAWQPVNTQYLVQSGVSNLADLKQTGYDNYSDVDQSGNYNSTKLDQSDAAMNSAAIWDKSYSKQTGISNLLDINQHGNPGLQLANSLQDGTSNTTNIKQLSWNEQQVISIQDGTSDVINITQSN